MQTTTPTPSNRASRLGARPMRRVALLLTVCGWLTAVMALGWTLCLLKLASWQAALIPAPGVAAGLLAVWFGSRGRPYIGGTIECVALYTMVCLTSLFLDQTTDQMPRTTHLFLVPLATGAYMALRGSSKLLRHGIVAFIFLTFVVLACTSLGGHPAHNLPDELRIIGGMVHTMAAIERHKVDPRRLKMELTESVFARDMDDLITKMKALKQYGVSFSLDDFGTGYSSLSYLKRLPLDQLKIDQAFVRDLLTQPRDLAIAKTIVDLGTSLNMAVMAEGVETREQHQILEAMGCRQFQGYLFGKPMPMAALLEQATRTHAHTPAPAPARPTEEPRAGAPVHA